MECKETQEVLWRQICDDEYMAYAVQECYYSVEKILNSMVNDEGRRWYSISVCLNLNVCLICEDHVC
jgi:callose synthase